MEPTAVAPDEPGQLALLQPVLSAALRACAERHVIHPGELAWWVHHADPRTAAGTTYWRWDDQAWVFLDAAHDEFAVFARPGAPITPIIEWAQRRMGGQAAIGFVSSQDRGLERSLAALHYAPVRGVMPLFVRDLSDEGGRPTAGPPPGWVIRPVAGEHEADNRRAASHAAFSSTMAPDEHLQRYLRFMRSPVYEAERDLVAVSPDGRIGAFLIWWPDLDSGVAQLEPVGTHPDFQRLGLGRALVERAVGDMAGAGMTTVRVCTDDHRTDATAFYASVGFAHVADLRWWAPRT